MIAGRRHRDNLWALEQARIAGPDGMDPDHFIALSAAQRRFR
jgi:hypothetical protein